MKNLYCVFNSFFDQCQLQRKALVVEIMESSDLIRSIRHILYDVTVRLIVRSLTTQLQVVQGTMVGSGVALTSAKLQNCCASLLEHHLPWKQGEAAPVSLLVQWRYTTTTIGRNTRHNRVDLIVEAIKSLFNGQGFQFQSKCFQYCMINKGRISYV